MTKFLSVFFIVIIFQYNNVFAVNTKEKDAKIEEYIQLAQQYQNDSVLKSILYAKEAYKIIAKDGNQEQSIKILNILSYTSQLIGRYNEAISYSLELLKIGDSTNDKELIATSYLQIGNSYRALLRFKDALNFHNLAILKYKELGDELLLASAYNDFGATCFENEMYEESLDCFEKSHHIFLEKKDTLNLARVYNSLGIIYSELDNLIEAKRYFLKSLRIFEERKQYNNVASLDNNLGKLYIELGEFEVAKEYLLKADNYSTEKNLIYVQLKNRQVYTELYKKQNNYKNAFNSLEHFIALNDSVRQKEIVQKVEQIRIAYDVDKMEKDLVLAKKHNLIKEKNIRIIIILSLGVFIIGLLLMIVLVIRNKQSKIKLLVIQKESEIANLKIAKIEEERRRVKEKFDIELAFKNRELTSTTMHIVQKNELINDIKNHLNGMEFQTSENTNIVKNIINEINQNVLTDKDWDVFVKHFKDVHPDFFDNLIKEHPTLTSKEVRYCAYSRLNLSIKEIAVVLNITNRGVEKARSRIRSKMTLSKDVDLNLYLQTFGN
jgi:tetratricopeptide (TPR) repeat protein